MPLGEEIESYTVRVMDGGMIVREVIVSTAAWTYTNAMQAVDAIEATFAISVAQNSISFGHGPFETVAVGP